MALTGTTIFSHILPVIFGFFGLMLVMAGALDDKNYILALGIILFCIGCALPYIVLKSVI